MNLSPLYPLLICGFLASSEEALQAPLTIMEDVKEIRSGLNMPPSEAENFGVKSSNPNDVQFFLYANPRDPTQHEELQYQNESSIRNSRFTPNARVIFLVHGFLENYLSENPALMRNAYLQTLSSPLNLISVNWGNLSTPSMLPAVIKSIQSLFPYYNEAVENVDKVGRRIADFILFLQNNRFLPSSARDCGRLIRLVGHSLGAHVSGMTGYYYLVSTGFLLDRIIGTDPARPHFQDRSIDKRLDSTDAYFVEVIHTDQGNFGYSGKLGTVDFFVNGGGPYQTDCGFDPVVECSHAISYKYFAKSILNSSIVACPQRGVEPPKLPPACSAKDAIIFGEFTPDEGSGSYGLSLSIK